MRGFISIHPSKSRLYCLRSGLVIFLGITLLWGCANHAPSHVVAAPPRGNAPIPWKMSHSQLLMAIQERWKKAVMGRLESLEGMQRVLFQLQPLVKEAAQQKGIQPYLRQMAHLQHLSLEQAKHRWVLYQLADIFIESGGDENQISSANAAGVAQWVPSLAREQGLRIAPAQSLVLTKQIEAINDQLTKTSDSPSTSPASLQPPQTLKALRDKLRAERARVDARFDTRKALFAQARYLLSLYPRFPSLQWIFQAYHGGQAGERKLLQLYEGKKAASSQLILHGDHGRPLPYEKVYLSVSPMHHVAAFDYLYSRGDDHRHYWWKVLVAAKFIKRFQKNPNELPLVWNALLPGRLQDALWYPNGPAYAFATPQEVHEAFQHHQLLSVEGLANTDIAFPPSSSHYPYLRPEAYGALRLILALYQKAGGTEPLTIGDCLFLTKSQTETVSSSPNKAPSSLSGPAPSFSYHTTGLTLDILPPTNPKSRHRLDYALDLLADRRIVAVTPAHDNGIDRWHICPNPLYGEALAAWATSPKEKLNDFVAKIIR